MRRSTVFLFGAAEKGDRCHPYYLASLAELLTVLGHPPELSEGIPYAIQTLLFEHGVIYFRVEEEGFSFDDYIAGLKLLRKKETKTPINAICMPGVGDRELIDATTPICHLHQSTLLINQRDLYDYLTVK